MSTEPIDTPLVAKAKAAKELTKKPWASVLGTNAEAFPGEAWHDCVLYLYAVRDPETGEWPPYARDTIEEAQGIGAVCELSPSGTGAKIIGKVPAVGGDHKLTLNLPDGSTVEVFVGRKFHLCLTGVLCDPGAAVGDSLPDLSKVVAMLQDAAVVKPGASKAKPVAVKNLDAKTKAVLVANGVEIVENTKPKKHLASKVAILKQPSRNGTYHGTKGKVRGGRFTKFAKTAWKRVKKTHPCLVCGGVDKCCHAPSLDDPVVVLCVKSSTFNGKTVLEKEAGGMPAFYHQIRKPYGDSSEILRGAVDPDKYAKLLGLSPASLNTDLINLVYARLLALCPLSVADDTDNRERGIDPQSLGYGTLPTSGRRKDIVAALVSDFGRDDLLGVPGFLIDATGGAAIHSGPGLLVPRRDKSGKIVSIVRRDPKADCVKNKWMPLSGGKNHDDSGGASCGVRLHWARAGDPSAPVIVTEGERKADIIAAKIPGVMVVSIPGVAAWAGSGLVDELAGFAVVRIAFDADLRTNPAVGKELLKLSRALKEPGRAIEYVTWDPPHKGLDDALLADAEITILAGNDADDFLAEIAGIHGVQSDECGGFDSTRPTIWVDGPEDKVLQQALGLLAARDDVYLKCGSLVDVVGSPGVLPSLRPMDSAGLAAVFAEVANWRKAKKETVVVAGVPVWLGARGRAHAGKAGVTSARSIEGVLPGPTINEKGDLINGGGYCLINGKGWYAAGSVLGLEIPDVPTLADCQAAEEVIRCVVQYFPWKVPLDYHKWLTGLLAAVTRPLVDATPMMLITAHSAGSGKSTLCRIITFILRGCEPDNLDWPGDVRNRDEELRKLFSGLIQGGETLALMDNLPDGETMTSPALCNLLTARVYKARRLGVNDGTTSGGVNRLFVWATGNNVMPGADLADRSLVVRLESRVANQRSVPFSTYGAIGDVIPYVEAHRAKLLSAVLTVVKGYIKLGSPPQAGGSWGSYSDFLRLPVGIVRWVCGVDPIADRAEVVEEDPVAAGAGVLLVAWLGHYKDGGEFAAGRLLKDTIPQIGGNNSTAEALRDALAALGRGDTVQGIGRILQRIVGRRIVCAGKTYYLAKRADAHSKSAKYSFVHEATETTSAGIAGIAGSCVSQHACEEDEHILFENSLGANQPAKTPAIPAIPATDGLKPAPHSTESCHLSKANPVPPVFHGVGHFVFGSSVGPYGGGF